jgi:hypothetical protein
MLPDAIAARTAAAFSIRDGTTFVTCYVGLMAAHLDKETAQHLTLATSSGATI